MFENFNFFENKKSPEPEAEPEILSVDAVDPDTGRPIAEQEGLNVVHSSDKIASGYVNSLKQGGVTAPDVVDISMPQGKNEPKNTVSMEGAVELETAEDVANQPARREKIEQGLEMLWERFHMQRGEMKGKVADMTKLLLKANILNEHESKLDSSKIMITELAAKIDDAKSQAEFKAKTERQLK